MQVMSNKTTYMSIMCNTFMSAPSDYHKCLSAFVAQTHKLLGLTHMPVVFLSLHL